MAKKKEEEKDTPDNSHMIIPDGCMMLGIVQLARDLQPSPAAQRINMVVNRGGKLYSYISQNAFIRSELMTHFNQIVVKSYSESIGAGGASLHAYPWRIHWCEFTADFCNTGDGDRVNPITGEKLAKGDEGPKYFSTPVVA